MENVPVLAAVASGGAAAAAAAAAALVPPSPRGRVVGIMKRNWKHYCGSLASDGDLAVSQAAGSGGSSGSGARAVSCLVVPVDRRIPRVRIVTRQRDALAGKRLVVAIDDWPANSRYPRGHYVSTLGTSGDKAVETAVLLLEHDIPTGDFTGEVLSCLPPEGWEVDDVAVAAECRLGATNAAGGGGGGAAAMDDDDASGRKDVSQRSGKADAFARPPRRDLRHLPVMSIDPPGCRDIDDALHWRDLGNGLWEVGIHIADVTHFMAADTPLDQEAANRSTSTYLVDRRLDMLPKMLTEKLCSLVGHKDRFAFSVLLTVTPDGEIVEADFCKSVIHSIGAHTYGQAQDMLDDPSDTSPKAESVRKLNHLARIFRRRRMEAGALTLASPEVRACERSGS
jgi:exosome complex exonuclease DIS3/RRP44